MLRIFSHTHSGVCELLRLSSLRSSAPQAPAVALKIKLVSRWMRRAFGWGGVGWCRAQDPSIVQKAKRIWTDSVRCCKLTLNFKTDLLMNTKPVTNRSETKLKRKTQKKHQNAILRLFLVVAFLPCFIQCSCFLRECFNFKTGTFFNLPSSSGNFLLKRPESRRKRISV